MNLPHYTYVPGIDTLEKLPTWFYTDGWIISVLSLGGVFVLVLFVEIIHFILITLFVDRLTSTHIALFIESFGIAYLYSGYFHIIFDKTRGYCPLFIGALLVLSSQILIGTVTIKSINNAPRLKFTNRCCSNAVLQKLHKLNIRYILLIEIPLFLFGVILIILYGNFLKEWLRKICDIYVALIGIAGICVTLVGIKCTRDIRLPFSWFIKLFPGLLVFIFWWIQLLSHWILPETDTKLIIIEIVALILGFISSITGLILVILQCVKR